MQLENDVPLPTAQMQELSESVPLPATQMPRGAPAKYPFREIQVGQSFAVPNRTSLSTKVWATQTGYSFTTRRMIEDGKRVIRVWRTA